MFSDNNILPFILTFLPVLIFSLIIYSKIRGSNISLKKTSLYFLSVILCTVFVIYVFYIFPSFHQDGDVDLNPLSITPLFDVFIVSFLKIALLEEGMKLVSFKVINWHYPLKYEKPASIIFYSMVVSCGFAFSENLVYMMHETSPDVLVMRSFTSVIVHMICGLLMGRMISYGFNLGKLKNIMWTCIGLLVAVFIHGSYDTFDTLESNNLTNIIIFMSIGIMISYFLCEDVLDKNTI